MKEIMREYKVGDTFSVGRVRVVEATIAEGCEGCYYEGTGCPGRMCDSSDRVDGLNVKYVEVEEKRR